MRINKIFMITVTRLDYHDYHHHNSYMGIPLTEHHTFDWANCISFWQCSEILPDFLLKEFSSSKSYFFLYPVKNEFCAPNFLRNHPFSTYAKFPKKNIQRATKVRFLRTFYPAGNYMFKVSNKNIRTRFEICSESTIKIPERRLLHKNR